MSSEEISNIRKTLHEALDYLDKNVLKIGDSIQTVLDLLGEPYGEWGRDSWLYPGIEANKFYRLDFRNDLLHNKYFDTIYDAEYGR